MLRVLFACVTADAVKEEELKDAILMVFANKQVCRDALQCLLCFVALC
jgi:hypothetical protein